LTRRTVGCDRAAGRPPGWLGYQGKTMARRRRMPRECLIPFPTPLVTATAPVTAQVATTCAAAAAGRMDSRSVDLTEVAPAIGSACGLSLQVTRAASDIVEDVRLPVVSVATESNRRCPAGPNDSGSHQHGQRLGDPGPLAWASWPDRPGSRLAIIDLLCAQGRQADREDADVAAVSQPRRAEGLW